MVLLALLMERHHSKDVEEVREQVVRARRRSIYRCRVPRQSSQGVWRITRQQEGRGGCVQWKELEHDGAAELDLRTPQDHCKAALNRMEPVGWERKQRVDAHFISKRHPGCFEERL